MFKSMILLRGKVVPALLCVAALTPAAAFGEEANYYTADFKCSDFSTIGFKVIDANADGKTWTPTSGGFSYRVLDGNSISAVTKYSSMIENADNDDWLITPGIRFEAGKTYRMTFIMAKHAYAEIPPSFELKLGTAKTAASMTTEVFPLTGLPQYGGNSLWSFETTITVPSTGDYYLGIHAIGTPGMKFGISELQIKQGVAMISPAAVTDLTVTPDPTGDKKATISFKAPTTAKDGSALTSISHIEIRCNGELVHNINNPAPGAQLSYDATVAVSGEYTYTVTAFSESGAGDVATATVFIGVNIPSAAVSVKAENTGNKTARISWEAPALDKDGYPIAASLIKYEVKRSPIYKNTWTTVAEGVTSLSYDDTVPDPVPSEDPDANPVPDQEFYIYSVTAYTAEGSADAVQTTPVPLGEPYAMPYLESFAKGRASHLFTSIIVDRSNYWSLTTNFEEVQSVDGDNGMVYLNGAIGGASAMLTGLVDLSSAAPTISYYTYNISGADPKEHTLEVVVTAADGTTKSFGEYTPAGGWNKTILRLDEFAGKSVKFAFIGRRNNNTELFIDNIAVSNIYRHDLRVAGISLPEKVKSSEPFDVKVSVLNFGSEVSGAYTVDLYCGDEKVDTYSASGLAVGAYDEVVFSQTQGILAPESISYHAVITADGDEDTANNTSETVSATVRKNSYPTVTDLSGSKSGAGVTLTWGEPDTSKAQPYEVLDDFESYDAWATSNVGGWVFVDQDKAQIAGFAECEMPGIPAYSQQSWWVFDNANEQFNNGSFNTLSGRQFLASMISGIKGENKIVQNDDWAISPELYGGQQTVTVNARSYSLVESERESFEILWSTGSTDPADFTSLAVFTDIPSDYNAYTADLPDGAKRFAVRNISNGKYVLMVDDVTYIPAGNPAAFSINGYNVYRDGVRLNDAPVEENEYTDAEAPAGDHNYNVTVLYSAGESLFSNTYNTAGSAIGTVDASLFSVYGAEGRIVVAGAQSPVSVYTADGRLVAKLPASMGSQQIAAAPGLYLVTCGNLTRKIAVR